MKMLWTYNFSLDIYRFSFTFLILTSSKSPIILRCAPRFYTTKINKMVFIEIKLIQALSNSKAIFQINNLKKQSHKPIPNILSKRNNHTISSSKVPVQYPIIFIPHKEGFNLFSYNNRVLQEQRLQLVCDLSNNAIRM